MDILFRGVVHPWLCDAMGHLTTRHYLAMFDEATYHLLYEVFAYSPSHEHWSGIGWADVRHTLDYIAEVRAGELVYIGGVLKKIGNKSITSSYTMKCSARNKVIAKMEAVTVLFDLKERRAISLSDSLRSMALKHIKS